MANLAMLDGASTVFMSGIHSHDRNVILKYCVENNIGTFVIPALATPLCPARIRCICSTCRC